jgi:hypothetical protein
MQAYWQKSIDFDRLVKGRHALSPYLYRENQGKLMGVNVCHRMGCHIAEEILMIREKSEALSLKERSQRIFSSRTPVGMRRRCSLPWKIAREGKVVEQHIREGRFQRSLALVTAISGLFTGLEVAYEHYRGSYGQRVMYTPLLLSFLLLVAGIWAALSRWAARTVLRVVSLITVIDGIAGFYYHIRGVARKPGGWRVPVFNVIMGPPVFAPLLFSTVGFLGLLASFLRQEDAPRAAVPALPWWVRSVPETLMHREVTLAQRVREGRFQRMLAVVTALSALFSWIEALYSHYKNNFSYRVQWSPIVTAPLLIVASIATVWSRTVARTLLPITSLVALINGMLGFFYHARGVVRRPGGLHKPFYNIVYGPPIFAPLIFSAAGGIGLLTSFLRRSTAK